MAIAYHELVHGLLRGITGGVAPGTVVGLLADDVAAARLLLRLAAGLERPAQGEVRTAGRARIVGPLDPLDLSPVENLLLDHAFAFQGPLARQRAFAALTRLRHAGAAIVVASHELDLLESLADEIWWLDEGVLKAQGDPRETLTAYRRHVAAQIRKEAQGQLPPLTPRFRRGDGRARLVSLETLDGQLRPTLAWTSGEAVAIRVVVEFAAPVEDPVVGILLRTRVGMEVYGTNTELEALKLGPVDPGHRRAILFRFTCALCPGDYVITAASHDPDGIWHDWLEDAAGITVLDSRYSAGVANLRAEVTRET
jgi:hypothetical protein